MVEPTNISAAGDPALLPVENPNPVLRASRDGRLLFANSASAGLLAQWGTAPDGRLPPDWCSRVARALAHARRERVIVACGDTLLELDLVPILEQDYVNFYGRDVTATGAAHEALASSLQDLNRERELQWALMEHSRASLVYLDRDFNFLSANAAYEDACLRPRSAMIGRNHFELFPNPENEAIFRRVRDTGEPVSFIAKPFEFVDQPWRGVTYWDWTLTPVKAPGGEVEGLIFSLVDVTERVRTQKLSDALNEIHAAIALEHDFQAIMRTLLTRSVAALGCASGAIGMREDGGWVTSCSVGIAGDHAGLRFTDAEAPIAMQVAATRQPVAVLEGASGFAVNGELMARYGVRAVLALPLIVREEVIGMLAFNYSGPRMPFSAAELDFASRLATVVSLTLENVRMLELESQQRRAAEKLAVELETTLEAVDDGVGLYDMAGRALRLNRAAVRILGYDPASVGLSPVQRAELIKVAIVDEPDAPAERLPLFRALSGETVRSQLMRFQPVGNPGEERFVLVSCTPVRDSQTGVQLGVVTSFHDVTELRRARDELELRVQERTAELEAIFASFPDAIYVGDENGFTRCNQATLDVFGCDSVEELRHKAAVLARRVDARYLATGLPVPPGELVLARALRGERAVQEVRGLHLRSGRELVYRSAAAPVLLHGKIIGAVGVATDITEEKRAEEALRRSRDQLAILHEIDHAVLAARSLEDTAGDALRRLRDTVPCDRAVVLLIDFDAQEVRYLGAEGEGPSGLQAGRSQLLALPPAVMDALRRGQTWYEEDMAADQAPIPSKAAAVRLGMRSWLAIPMHVEGRVFGVLSLTGNRPSAFDPDAIRLSQQIAVSLAVAIRNAQLLEDLQTHREQLKSLSHRLVELQESERGFVANELFNNQAQRLASVLFGLSAIENSVPDNPRLLEPIRRLRDTSSAILKDMHALAVNLRPVTLDRIGLEAALRQYAEALTREGELQLEVTTVPGAGQMGPVPREVETMVYRISRDVLDNAVRHSQATRIRVELSELAGWLKVAITDNGRGFSVEETLRKGAGLGLLGIRERAEMLGGRVDIASAPGQGTQVVIEVPLEGRGGQH